MHTIPLELLLYIAYTDSVVALVVIVVAMMRGFQIVVNNATKVRREVQHDWQASLLARQVPSSLLEYLEP